MVTHDPRAAAYADRVVFLGDGQVIGESRCDGMDSMAQRLRVIMDAMEKFQL
jgi:putative ABC transport system ATP-binding protein